MTKTATQAQKVEELKKEGLTHEFQITVASAQVEKQIDDQLVKLSKTVKVAGFRPGKVPLHIMRQRYATDVVADVVKQTLNDSSRALIEEKKLRPVVQPTVEVVDFDEGKDLVFKLSFDIVPEITFTDFSKIKLEKLSAEADEAEINKALDRLADRLKTSQKISEDRPAVMKDTTVIDFVGKLNGVPFPGGTSEKFPLELGSGQFIPGFEEKVVGMKVGDDRVITVSFPENYHSADLAGKEVTFDVKLHEIQASTKPAIDDELAKKAGYESLAAMKKDLEANFKNDYDRASQSRLRRDLVDQLAAAHDFPLPQSAIDAETRSIMAERHHGYDEQHAAHCEDPNHKHGPAPTEEQKKSYRETAEKNVKVGLLLSEFAQQNNIQVDEVSLQRALLNEARRYPGQEEKVFQYFKNNPEALSQLQLPLLEEKVLDTIIEKAAVTTKPVTVDALFS